MSPLDPLPPATIGGFRAVRQWSGLGALDAHHSFVDRHAMAHEVLPRGNEVLQRRVNVKKLDVRDEAVDAGVDARRGCTVHVSVGWYDVGEEAEIGEAPRISSVRLIPADPLKMITLKIEFARFSESLIGEACVLSHER